MHRETTRPGGGWSQHSSDSLCHRGQARGLRHENKFSPRKSRSRPSSSQRRLRLRKQRETLWLSFTGGKRLGSAGGPPFSWNATSHPRCLSVPAQFHSHHLRACSSQPGCDRGFDAECLLRHGQQRAPAIQWPFCITKRGFFLSFPWEQNLFCVDSH